MSSGLWGVHDNTEYNTSKILYTDAYVHHHCLFFEWIQHVMQFKRSRKHAAMNMTYTRSNDVYNICCIKLNVIFCSVTSNVVVPPTILGKLSRSATRRSWRSLTWLRQRKQPWEFQDLSPLKVLLGDHFQKVVLSSCKNRMFPSVGLMLSIPSSE